MRGISWRLCFSEWTLASAKGARVSACHDRFSAFDEGVGYTLLGPLLYPSDT